MRLRRLPCLAAAVSALIAPAAGAQTPTPMTVKDGNGNPQNLCEYTLSSSLIGCVAPHVYNGSTWGPQPADSGFRPYVDVYSLPAVSLTGSLPGFANAQAFKEQDSGGGDATDPTHHAVNVTAPLGATMLGQQFAYTVANAATDGEGTAAYLAGAMLCPATGSNGCGNPSNSGNYNTITFARTGVHITGWHIWLSDTSAWNPGAYLTIRAWWAAPTFNVNNGDHGAYSLTSGSQSWAGDWQCTLNAADSDGIDGNCVPVGATPDIPYNKLWLMIFTSTGSNAASGAQLQVELTPLGSY